MRSSDEDAWPLFGRHIPSRPGLFATFNSGVGFLPRSASVVGCYRTNTIITVLEYRSYCSCFGTGLVYSSEASHRCSITRIQIRMCVYVLPNLSASSPLIFSASTQQLMLNNFVMVVPYQILLIFNPCPVICPSGTPSYPHPHYKTRSPFFPSS
ncbi:hypothetical protein BDP27DRAFT_740200 [Rhodocollybia butyracea]|uniref:Uncharacterized protein n=1 Tax=Rhodocollybia butyracea TaxID=206335 RepID=A0A9P5PU98_9AGAR|nr:hypothetical protein BDP27DRAFT_740200 [Rhodocollybia butyracea]